MSKRRLPTMEESLAEMEATNPAVRAAAEKLDALSEVAALRKQLAERDAALAKVDERVRFGATEEAELRRQLAEKAEHERWCLFVKGEGLCTCREAREELGRLRAQARGFNKTLAEIEDEIGPGPKGEPYLGLTGEERARGTLGYVKRLKAQLAEKVDRAILTEKDEEIERLKRDYRCEKWNGGVRTEPLEDLDDIRSYAKRGGYPGVVLDLLEEIGRLERQAAGMKGELEVAWGDCTAGDCHACAKCFDSVNAQREKAEAALAEAFKVLEARCVEAVEIGRAIGQEHSAACVGRAGPDCVCARVAAARLVQIAKEGA